MENVFWIKNGKLMQEHIRRFFNFISRRGCIIAITGAGGKTTLMYELAKHLQSQGKRVLVTTTTHIYQPDTKVFCRSIQDCQNCWAEGRYAVWAQEAGNGKLCALDESDFERLSIADVVLVEADGAKHMPCKVPASHEPQIPRQADVVIGVMGLSAIGKPISESCFRPLDVAGFLNCKPEHLVSPDDLAKILASENGTRKDVGGRAYYAVLNQCDTLSHLEYGADALRLLSGSRVPAVMTCFQSKYLPEVEYQHGEK